MPSISFARTHPGRGQRRHEDLFWALRGAGAGNFGVVTSLVFQLVPAPVVTNAHLTWPFSEAGAVIAAWPAWAPDGPDELVASLKLTDPGGPDPAPSVDVHAALQGSESDAAELLGELVARAGSDPSSSFVRMMSFRETRKFWANLEADEAGAVDIGKAMAPHVYLVDRSEFFGRPLPAEAIGALIATFTEGRAAGEARELDFMPWGGAYNRFQPEATAFVHRNERFQHKHAAVVNPAASTASKEAARRWVTRSWASVHSWGSGCVFQNFVDLDPEDWPKAYYADNYDRLVRVKARYDPAGLFRSAQSIPVRSAGA